MYSSEFKSMAMKTLERCGESRTKAAREFGVVCSNTLRRWIDQEEKRAIDAMSSVLG